MAKLYVIFVLLGVIPLFADAKLNICLNFKKTTGDILTNQEGSPVPIDNATVFYDYFPILLVHPAFSFDGQFKNLTVGNLNYTTRTILKNDQLINVTFSDITLTADYYNLTGNIGNLFDIFGQGNFSGHLKEFSISFSILGINLNASSLCIPISIDVDLHETSLNFGNFMNDKDLGDLMNVAFGAIIPDIVRGIWQELKESNDARLEQAINWFINHLLTNDEEMRTAIENYLKQKFTQLENSIRNK